MRKTVITGGCGFIGHHVVEHFIKNTDDSIVILDKLEHDSAMDRLRDINCFREDRVLTLACDMQEKITEGVVKEIDGCDVILHLAAESHVDNSIIDPASFIRNNVMSTVHLLNAARKLSSKPLFLYFSTDEVFGPCPDGYLFKEDDVHTPKNPYAASKSASEQVVTSFANTFKMPVVITRCMNVFGERQHPEKFVPMIIKSLLDGKTITIHADPTKTRAGSRFYIHARNVADAVLTILQSPIGFINGEAFHIVGEREIDNLELAEMIAKIVGKPLNYEMVDFHSSRPGHDLRYGMSGKKMEEQLGWKPPMHVEESLRRMVEWTLNNRRWL
ncbi:MAG: dTDP-glucose 4,6-dehydratase [bacterium]